MGHIKYLDWTDSSSSLDTSAAEQYVTVVSVKASNQIKSKLPHGKHLMAGLTAHCRVSRQGR
jgi:hypothetical protein